MTIECKTGLYLKVAPGGVVADPGCPTDSRLNHNGCASVVTYGPITLLSDGSIHVATASGNIVIDTGETFTAQSDSDIVLHPGSGCKVKVYGDLEVYGQITQQSAGSIPSKVDPLT